MDRREGRGERHEAGASDASGSLRRQEKHAQQNDLVAEGKIGVRRLGYEDGGHGKVDRRAVGIERVAGGQHHADDGLVATEPFELDQHLRHHRFGRAGAEDDEDLVLEVTEELRQRKTGPRRDTAEHHDDEENGGDVDTEHQIAERPERRDPVLPDRERDPRPGS